MNARTKVAVVSVAAAVAAVGWLVPGHARQGDEQVSLTFERYSDFDAHVSNVAFLRLTNASSNSYLLTMAGNTNTLILDTSFGRFRESWMLNSEFSDETPRGWSNWSQLPSPCIGSNAYVSLGPHSGIVIRTPVPPEGRRRRVAVLYQPMVAGWRQSGFWTNSLGRATMGVVVRTLPKSAVLKLIGQPPVLLKAWCDTELTNHFDGVGDGSR